MHNQYVKEVELAVSEKALDFVMYGDSITEQMRGTCMGHSLCSRAASTAAPWNKHIGDKFSAAAFGISGDEVGHLWWRLENGELSLGAPPKVAGILIGTNDMGVTYCEGADLVQIAQTIAESVGGMVAYMREAAPMTRIVLVGVLPKGGLTNRFAWPNMWTPALDVLNERLARLADADNFVRFANCTPGFTADGHILADLLPDGIHPSGAGMDALLNCLMATVGDWL
jgi:lysophospholipase L1-like esterase